MTSRRLRRRCHCCSISLVRIDIAILEKQECAGLLPHSKVQWHLPVREAAPLVGTVTCQVRDQVDTD